jgi:hypothetical protein
MSDDSLGDALTALSRAKDSPLDDSVITDAITRIVQFEDRNPYPEVEYYTKIARTHLSQAKRYKTHSKKLECIERADDQFRNRVPQVLRELREQGKI